MGQQTEDSRNKITYKTSRCDVQLELVAAVRRIRARSRTMNTMRNFIRNSNADLGSHVWGGPIYGPFGTLGPQSPTTLPLAQLPFWAQPRWM